VAAKTSVQSGNWSDAATWGGSVPADGDTVAISAGHTVIFDVDLSAWTTGVAGLTTTGSSGTPGRLECATANGTYVLPIKTGTQIVGTSAANKGQLCAGSAGTPLPNGAKFTIKLLGTSSSGGSINRQYLDVQLYCTQPIYKWVKLSQTENAGTTILHVDTDVTGDIWAAGDIVALCNINKGCDYQRTTIAAGGIAATTITVTNALDSQNLAGSYLVRITRNIEITLEGTQVAITGSYGAASNSVWQCCIRQTSATVQGTALQYGTGDTVSGVINGVSDGVNACVNAVVSGCVVGVSRACTNTSGLISNLLFSGLAAGCSGYILYGVSGGEFSGVGVGSLYGIIYTTGLRLSGTLLGNNLALVQSRVEATGSILGNTFAMGSLVGYGGAGCVVLRQGCVVGGSAADANTQDVSPSSGKVLGYGAGLRSSIQVANYLQTASFPDTMVCLYDVADAAGNPQPGRMKWWNCGGYGASEDWAQGTHGDPPVPLSYVHKHTFEASGYGNLIDVPIWGEKDVPLTVKVYIRKQQNGMTAIPTAKLIDPNRPLGHASEALATATMADDTNWQTLTLSYTPAHDRQLVLRVAAKNGSGTMYWNFDVYAGCRRRPAARLAGV
jgi:hypothetical protein